MELEFTPMLLRNKVTLNAGFVTNTPSPLCVITNGVGGGGGTGPSTPRPPPKPTSPPSPAKVRTTVMAHGMAVNNVVSKELHKLVLITIA